MLKWISAAFLLLLGLLGVTRRQLVSAKEKAEDQSRLAGTLTEVREVERKIADAQRAAQEAQKHESKPVTSRPSGNFGADSLRDKP